jgi:hypothetical protein
MSVEKKKLILFVALFYPLALALMAAGFLAFIMLLLKIDLIVVGSVALWFYFICAVLVFVVSKRVLKMLGFHGLFLVMILVAGVLASLSTIAWLLKV